MTKRCPLGRKLRRMIRKIWSKARHFIKQDRHSIKAKLKRRLHILLLSALFFSVKFNIESNF